MNNSEKIVLLKKKTAGTKDETAYWDAEQVLFDTVSAALGMVSPRDAIDTLNGNQPAPKKPLSLKTAMEAFDALRLLGAQYAVDIPAFEDIREFGLWLITEYGRFILENP